MPSLLSRYGDHNDASTRRLALPIILLLTSVLANVGTPVPHSLLTSAVAWAGIWVYTGIRSRRNNGSQSHGGGGANKGAAWAAGALLALAQICERSVDGRGIWWANVCTCYTRVERNSFVLANTCLSRNRVFSHCLSTLSTEPASWLPSPTPHPRVQRSCRDLKQRRLSLALRPLW